MPVATPNSLFLDHNGTNFTYQLGNDYDGLEPMTEFPYDLSIFPVVDGKLIVDFSINPLNPYDVIMLPFDNTKFIMHDEAGRLIDFGANSNLTIDGVVSGVSVTDNYIILCDYNSYRINKRSFFPQTVSITPSGSVTTDLTPVLTAITDAKNEILNFVPAIDLTPIDASLTTIKGYTDTLETDLAIIKTGFEGVLKDSLNGNGSEFIDGLEVLVTGRTIIYTVARSYMGLVQDNGYTTFYDLTALNGSKLTVPEALLTQYVAPVTAP